MKSKTRVTKLAAPSNVPGQPKTEAAESVLPTRRQFLQTTAGAGLALAGSSMMAWADPEMPFIIPLFLAATNFSLVRQTGNWTLKSGLGCRLKTSAQIR